MKRFYILLFALFGPYVIGILYLANADASRLPTWVWRTIPIYFVAAIVVLGIWGRPRASSEAARPSAPTIARRRRVSRWAVVLYAIVLINAIMLIWREFVLFHVAAPALVIIVLMICIFSWMYSRSTPDKNGGPGRD